MVSSLRLDTTALLIVDMMNDHIHPDGAANRFGAEMQDADREMIVRNNRRLLEAVRATNRPIVHVRNEYRWDNLDCGTSKARKRQHHATYPADVPYKIIGTWGAQIIDELAPLDSEVVVVKKNQSAFWCTELDPILRRLNVETCVTTGGAVSGCLNDTVREGAGLGYKFVVVTDAVYRRHDPMIHALCHVASLASTEDMLTAVGVAQRTR